MAGIENFDSDTDLWELTKRLKSQAIKSGHENPGITGSGNTFHLTCSSCGNSTRMREEAGQWNAQRSIRHTLHERDPRSRGLINPTQFPVP